MISYAHLQINAHIKNILTVITQIERKKSNHRLNCENCKL